MKAMGPTKRCNCGWSRCGCSRDLAYSGCIQLYAGVGAANGGRPKEQRILGSGPGCKDFLEVFHDGQPAQTAGFRDRTPIKLSE